MLNKYLLPLMAFAPSGFLFYIYFVLFNNGYLESMLIPLSVGSAISFSLFFLYMITRENIIAFFSVVVINSAFVFLIYEQVNLELSEIDAISYKKLYEIIQDEQSLSNLVKQAMNDGIINHIEYSQIKNAYLNSSSKSEAKVALKEKISKQ